MITNSLTWVKSEWQSSAKKKASEKKTEKCWRNKKYKEQWFSFWKICTPKERVLFYLFKKKSDRLIHNNVYRPCSVLNEIKTKKNMPRHDTKTHFPLEPLIRFIACALILCISTECTIIIVEDAKGMCMCTLYTCTSFYEVHVRLITIKFSFHKFTLKPRPSTSDLTA